MKERLPKIGKFTVGNSMYIYVITFIKLSFFHIFQERTLFDNLIFTSVKSDVFYYGTYEASFNIVADDCGKKPILFCSIGNEYNIVTISGEPIRNCTGI
jgi:hypothetical protein